MPINDDLGTRLKSFYEDRSKTYLLRRTPVIIRLDGCHFHTFCKRFEKPYDKFLNECLNNTLKYLCSKVQCVKMGQRHSDEMSLLLIDYENIQTEPYFDYNVQKICSVVASMATAEFCKQLTEDTISRTENKVLTWNEDWPTFDCRCFNVPEKEISNYFWWRLLDCKRSSINMLSQHHFSHKELQGLNCNQMQEKLFSEKGINWDSIPQEQKSGMICLRKDVIKPIENGPSKGEFCNRSVWSLEPAPKLKGDLDLIIHNILSFPKFVGFK